MRENVIGGLLSPFNSHYTLLDAVPANGSDGPHCLPVPLCLKRMQVLQRNRDHHDSKTVIHHSTYFLVHHQGGSSYKRINLE